MLRIYNTIKKIFIQVNCLYNDNLGIARNTSIGKAAYVKVVDDFHTINAIYPSASPDAHFSITCNAES